MTREQRRQLADVRKQAEKKGITVNVREVYDSDAETASRVVGTPGAIAIFGVHTARDQSTQETIGPVTSTGILARAGIVYAGTETTPYDIRDRGPTRADLVVVMGCDSNETRDAFLGAANYIGVDGGPDHGSSTYGLNQGIIETLKAIVDASGVINQETLNNIVANTQQVIRTNPAQGNPDPDDSVILNPAPRVPTPGRRVP